MTAVRLALFGLITSTLVGVVYLWTAEPIARAQQQARDQAILEMLSESDGLVLGTELRLQSPRLLEQLGWTAPIVVRTVLHEGAVTGYLLPIRAPRGYAGPIDLLLAITPEADVLALRVTAHRETPGLGDGIDHRKSDWIRQFSGQSLASHPLKDWAVRPDGGSIDAFTGATITPRAVVEALRRALIAVTEDPTWPTLLEGL